MSRFYAVGGRQRRRIQEEWHQYDCAVIVELDVESGAVEPRVLYETPPEARPASQPSILFKAATHTGDRLLVCTQTEVLEYSLPDFACRRRVSLPCFNDLHHVVPTEAGTWLVVSTGLDLIVEVSPDGELQREWSAVDEDTWSRFDRRVDYRRVATTKPHRAHPNYLFRVGEELFVTRFQQSDAVSLSDPSRRIEIGGAQPHDGVVHGDSVYFTQVDGRVAIADAATLALREVVDLAAISPDEFALGWCRGIHVVDPDHVIVGFSRLRPTRIRQNLSWLRAQLDGSRKAGSYPTRLALYDLRAKRLVWERETEAAGLHTVFSLHPVAGR